MHPTSLNGHEYTPSPESSHQQQADPADSSNIEGGLPISADAEEREHPFIVVREDVQGTISEPMH